MGCTSARPSTRNRINKKIKIIWVDPNVDNYENSSYLDQLRSIGFKQIDTFKYVEDSISYLEGIRFEETIVILSGKIYIEFIEKFKKNLKNIFVIPKFVIFLNRKNEFLKKNENYKDIINHSFYNFGGIKTVFFEIKNFILNSENSQEIKKNEDEKEEFGSKINYQKDKFIFEYIDCKEKLILPNLFKMYISSTSENEIEIFNQLLMDKYADEDILNKLLNSININEIPLELLSRYYSRIFTAESKFYKDVNKDLIENKIESYLPYIKALYKSIELETFPLASDKTLYRGGKLSKVEIEKIQSYLESKNEILPAAIIFSKTFLSFTKSEEIAKNFLKKLYINENFSKVLFELENDEQIDHTLSTHVDIEDISFSPLEKEVLFLPFSSFEIKEISKSDENENIYKIKLKYLGKYLKDSQNDKNLSDNSKCLPNSEFQDEITKTGLINKETIENKSIKEMFKDFNEYIIKLTENNENIENNEKNESIINTDYITKNCIIGEIYIKEEDINKDIRIINSIENSKKQMEDKNEAEIKNCDIYINDENIGFSYFYKFKKEGKYKIVYVFKNEMINCNFMFFECLSLTNLDLSHFNTKKIKKTEFMFAECLSLTNLNLSHFNTKNVTHMTAMFGGCSSLTTLNLSSFNTQNVVKMSGMFCNCLSLSNLNLSNFNTKSVANMNHMFNRCPSLNSLNLSNFKSQNTLQMNELFSGCQSLKNENLICNDNIIKSKLNKINLTE